MEYIPRLKEKYQKEVVNNLKGNYKSIMQVPKLVKICLNQGLGSASSDKKQIEAAQQEMTIISGQKAMLTHATKDISNFKLRKGMPVGVMVTLRGNQMYEFLDRLVTSTIPRIRDFNGISTKGFDGRGNYTMGIKEQIAFPEISIDKISKITGMDITFVTNTDSDTDALLVLKELGLPFKEYDAKEKERELEISKKKEAEKQEAEKQEVEKQEVEKQEVEKQDKLETSNTEDMVSVEEEKNNSTSEHSEIDNNQNSSEDSEKTES